MPCDSVSEVTIALTTADKDLLVKGLRNSGYTVDDQRISGYLRVSRQEDQKRNRRWVSQAYIDLKAGTVRLTETGVEQDVVNEIKRSYAVEVVKASAARFGWTFKQDSKQENKLHLGRRF